jgi:hypothetical protein
MEYCTYELTYSIHSLINDAIKFTNEGLKVAVFLDMDRTVTQGIISNPEYKLTDEDIRDGVKSGIDELIEQGCIVSILTARGNGSQIDPNGNELLHRYPTDLSNVLGEKWGKHNAFNFKEEFISKKLVVNDKQMKGINGESFYVTYDTRKGHGSFIYGGGKQEKCCDYGVKGGVIVSLVMNNLLKFKPDIVLFGDNAAFNIYEVKLSLDKHKIKSKVYHIANLPGTQRDQLNPLSSSLPYADDKVFSSWEELVVSKGQ